MNEEETTLPVDTATDTPSAAPAKKKRTIIIASTIAGVLILGSGITGGVLAYQHHQHTQAVSACVKTVKPLREAVNKLTTAQTSKNTTELVKLDVKKLADKTTHDKLVEAVKPVSVSVSSCEESLSTERLVAREKANKKAREEVTAAQARVEQAVSAVNKSRTMKSRTVLTELVKSARAVVKDSAGKVQDGKTIESLNAILTTADKLVQDKGVDSTKLDKQAADVQKAIDSVKASVEAKRKADEEAARKAEEARQAQAAAQAAQQAQTYRAQAYRAPAQSYRAPAQTYRAPAQSYRAPTQTYQQPAQNNGGGTTKRIGGSEGSIYQWNGKHATPEDMCLITGMCH